MKEYKLEFEVSEKSIYYTIVEADSPKDAIQKYLDYPNNYDSKEEILLESTDLKDTIKCVGVYHEVDTNGMSLKRYKRPVKL